MEIGDKLRFRRKELKITRNELAEKVHVTPSAIANYENGISYPKPDILISLMISLEIDANYLYQDYLPEQTIQNLYENLSIEEKDALTRYRLLTDYGKKLVRLVIDEEYKRMEKENWITLLCCQSGEWKENSGFLFQKESMEIRCKREHLPVDTDFCFQIQEDCYEPIFRKSDVIALKKRDARHNEMGIFCLNGICYIRTLFQKGEDCRLCSLNVVDADIEVQEGDSLICVGTILGKVFGEVEITVQQKLSRKNMEQLQDKIDE